MKKTQVAVIGGGAHGRLAPEVELEARQEELWREVEEERERVFQTRLSPSRTRTIEAVPYVPPPAPSVQKASGSSGSSRDTSVNSSSSSAKKSGDSGKKDIKSKSKRRRGR